METFKVAIAGFGRIAQVHAQAWQSLDGAQVTAIFDGSPAARNKAAEAGFTPYDGLEEMIERERPDAISVCTPPASHLPAARVCLERGVNVLCEKPLAIDLPSTAELIACANRSRAALLLATKFRHVPEIHLAREHIRSGDIGTPLLFEIEFSSVVDMAGRWNSESSISGGGVIIDNACHALDLVSYLFGGVTAVEAIRLPSVQFLDVEDSALLFVSTRAGVSGQITVSWSMNALRDTYLRVRGSRGTIRIGWRGSQFLKREDGERTPVPLGDGYDKVAAHTAMMRACRDVIAGRRDPWVSHEECLATAAAVEAAYRSLESGGWVSVKRGAAKGEAA